MTVGSGTTRGPRRAGAPASHPEGLLWHRPDGKNFRIDEFGGGSAVHQFDEIVTNVTPEPASVALTLTGLVAVGVVARRRRA